MRKETIFQQIFKTFWYELEHTCHLFTEVRNRMNITNLCWRTHLVQPVRTLCGKSQRRLPDDDVRNMSRAVLQVFEEYQKARVTFVQTIADLATRPQNIDALQNAGVIFESFGALRYCLIPGLSKRTYSAKT